MGSLSATGRTSLQRISGSRVNGWDQQAAVLREQRVIEFTAPISPNNKCRVERVIENRSHPARVRLLVVDDHSVVRHGVASWLRAHINYEVVGEAGTAREAIAHAVISKPDVVLLDVGLPGESGLCAAYEIFRTCPMTKVVGFSASADPVHVRGMLAAGAKAYVLKTSEPPVIVSAIRAVLRGSRFLDPALSDALVEELDLFPEPNRGSRQILSTRETQVLECIVWGYNTREIGAKLGVKETSVNTFRGRLCVKLGLTNRADLVRYGVAIGLITSHRPKRLPVSVSDQHVVFAGGMETGR